MDYVRVGISKKLMSLITAVLMIGTITVTLFSTSTDVYADEGVGDVVVHAAIGAAVGGITGGPAGAIGGAIRGAVLEIVIEVVTPEVY